MKNLKLVPVSQAPSQGSPGLTMPKHFKVAQKAAWTDLTESADPGLRTPENRFAFEIAAVLMAKFRSGKPMNATETKELRRQLVGFGLEKDDDGAGKKKTGNAAKYFSGT